MELKTELDPVYLLKLNGYENNGDGKGYCRYVDNKGSRFHALLKNGKWDIHFDQSKEVNGRKIHISTKYYCWQRLAKEVKRIKNFSFPYKT